MGAVGTKSVLFGVHQFLWHPITVLLAWIELYGIPNWRELVCIFIHDLGYWGKPNMDGYEGEKHPEWAAWFATWYLDRFPRLPYFPYDDYHDLCLLHSRSYAKKVKRQPSKLCWADKLSVKYDPWWFYLLRARLSGEIWEYRKDAICLGAITERATMREWFEWAKERGIRVARTRDPAKAYEKLVV
jgi:hypothetical protein